MSITEIDYSPGLSVLRLANELVDLAITTNVGPRVIRFGFLGDENEFAELPTVSMAAYGEEWHMFGGHRLWHAPEIAPRTYHPDNEPVQWQPQGDGVRIIQPVERHNGIQKELDVWLDPSSAHVRITHRLINRGVWLVELAPWAISVMAPGGVGIIPLPERGSHSENLLPTSSLALWAYTDFSDPRWTWGRQFILLLSAPIRKRLARSSPLAGWPMPAEAISLSRPSLWIRRRLIPISTATSNCSRTISSKRSRPLAQW
jgi:hypothetical protein